MDVNRHIWAIVLAAGEGSRLRSLTTDDQGVVIPKQFCHFHGKKSLLRSTLERAERFVPKERIVTIVAAQHEHWWKPELIKFPSKNIIVQPKNRGTAVGVLLPLLAIFSKDHHAKVLVLPSDHYVKDEVILEKEIQRTFPAAEEKFNRIILLGMTPNSPDPEYGWIVPSASGDKNFRLQDVAAFVEKPPVSVAEELMKQGALWNSFIFIATVGTFLRLYAQVLPELLDSFRIEPKDLSSLYDFLPTRDFSRDLLEKVINHLWVLPVPPCGWSDMGTPKRVTSVLRKMHDDRSSKILAHTG